MDLKKIMDKIDIKNYKQIEPRDWNPIDYVSYIYDSGVIDYYWNFYNCIDGGISFGFRPPSIDISRTWAIEKKFYIHKCYKHKGEKHSELLLDNKYPTATWMCPKSKWKTQIPHRYNEMGGFVPIAFDINDKNRGLLEILKLGYKARIWHFEMSIFKNIFRGESIFPDRLKIHTQGDKWERVSAHNLIMEFDTTEKRENGENVRRDFMEEGDKIVVNAQKIIDSINGEMDKVGISAYEWWFSGGGLYFLLHHKLNDEARKDESRKDKNSTNLQWFNSELYMWDKYLVKILQLLEKEKVRYIGLDYKKQFIRSYLKAPYSLHRRFDRITLPLTGFFGGNDRIDLMGSGWRRYIYPKNMGRDIIKKIKVDI